MKPLQSKSSKQKYKHSGKIWIDTRRKKNVKIGGKEPKTKQAKVSQKVILNKRGQNEEYTAEKQRKKL